MLTRVAYRKTSLIDFPGRVAAVLFLPGCDFRCPYCHNAALVDGRDGPEGLVPISEVFDHLASRAKLLSGVVLSGGEPLLFEETVDLARRIRGLGYALKLDTNGSRPERIALAHADYVALDLKTSPSAYGRVAPGDPRAGDAVVESLKALRRWGGEFEIRITCAPDVVGEEEIEEMSRLLEDEDRVVLQSFRPGGCLDPSWDEVQPYPDSVMRSFLERVRRAAPLARIRG